MTSVLFTLLLYRLLLSRNNLRRCLAATSVVRASNGAVLLGDHAEKLLLADGVVSGNICG